MKIGQYLTAAAKNGHDMNTHPDKQPQMSGGSLPNSSSWLS